ncbi:MAG TPA: urease accessory protein UreD [Vicinamibacterales bacterium]|nr:urease accessory protein UreD [Vicinamibacterales bacterium]
MGAGARLELSFERRAGRTVLARSYAEPPFRVGPALDVDGAAYLILVCTGPGIFGGDDVRLSIHVGRGARVVLTSQSALQVHPSADRSMAHIRQNFRIDEDGELIAEWDPAIPFAGARLDQRIAIDLAAGTRLLWSDAVMSGRAGRGESWRFASLAHELAARTDGSLAYLERYRLTPDRRPARTWMAGQAHYAGTVLVAHAGATPGAATGLHATLQSAGGEGTSAGADLVQEGLLVARLLSASGRCFAAAREAARVAVLESIFGRAAGVKRK